MLPGALTFIDVETSGSSLGRSRIIEIGIIRVENNQIVETFHSLVDPGTHVPPEILEFTGITQDELKKAPTFSQIKDAVHELFSDSIFVAHNVKFDYSFVKKEFNLAEEKFNAKTICTVNLSKALFPFFRRHNLDALIDRHGLTCVRRHRAIDDARVLAEFYQKILDEIPTETLEKVFNKVLKNANIPINIKPKILDKLPETSGIYVFYGKNGVPLYVGKSVNIKNRVRSHFTGSNTTTKDLELSQQVIDVSYIETAGELGALLKEAELVKELQPLYNSYLRNRQNMVLLKSFKNTDGYETVEVVEASNPTYDEVKNSLGIFKNISQAKKTLETARDEHELCGKLLGLEGIKNANSKKSPCFLHQLEKCRGACVDRENPLKYNIRFYEAFAGSKLIAWPFEGSVIINETGLLNGRTEYFLVNNWKVLKTVENEGEPTENSLDDIEQDYTFDPDTYKIIKNFLKKKGNLENIKIISN